MKDFTASVIQFSNFKDGQQRNRSEFFSLIEDNIKKLHASDLVVLPELGTTPYIMSEENIDNGSLGYEDDVTRYRDIALRTQKYLLGTGVKSRNSHIYNVAFLIGPNGQILGEYEKNHIPQGEETFFSGGNNFFVIHTPLATFGILICYDAQFPESFRILKQMGAEVILLPINSSVHFHEVDVDIENWMAICKYNALVNSMYVVMANKVEEIGTSGRFHTGHSVIVNPFGEIVARGSMREQNVTGTLYSETFQKYQNTYSACRRDDLYEKFGKNYNE